MSTSPFPGLPKLDRKEGYPCEQVLMAEYHLNRNYILRGEAVINELYEFLGLEPTDWGAEAGWHIKHGTDERADGGGRGYVGDSSQSF